MLLRTFQDLLLLLFQVVIFLATEDFRNSTTVVTTTSNFLLLVMSRQQSRHVFSDTGTVPIRETELTGELKQKQRSQQHAVRVQLEPSWVRDII